MTDHIAAVRARAEKQSLKLFPDDSWRRNEERTAYVEGQVTLALRLTREKIAEAIHRTVYKTLDIDDLADENYLELFDQADAILALLERGDDDTTT